MIKTLVTGGAGYIGSFAARELWKQGYNPVVIDNLSTGHKNTVGSTFYKADLLDKKIIDKIFKKEKFNAVIHFASLTSVSESIKKPDWYYYHNIISTINILENMVKNKIPHIVFSSSCSIYGMPKTLPVTESSPVNPESIYALTKFHIEQLLDFYSKTFGIKYVSLRYFNAAGADIDGQMGENHNPETHIIPNAIKALLGKKQFILYGNNYKTFDGTCIRDYVHTLDLAAAHTKALEYLVKNHKNNIFNLGGGIGYSNWEILMAIQEISGREIKIKIAPKRSGDPAEIFADNKKAKRLLGWIPKYSNLETIITTALKWHIKNTCKSTVPIKPMRNMQKLTNFNNSF